MINRSTVRITLGCYTTKMTWYNPNKLRIDGNRRDMAMHLIYLINSLSNVPVLTVSALVSRTLGLYLETQYQKTKEKKPWHVETRREERVSFLFFCSKQSCVDYTLVSLNTRRCTSPVIFRFCRGVLPLCYPAIVSKDLCNIYVM